MKQQRELFRTNSCDRFGFLPRMTAPDGRQHIVALSGGKDSVALALRLNEVEPRKYDFVCTPTGNELPEMVDHWVKLGSLLGSPIKPIGNGDSLGSLIRQWNALPNWRMRWCTRMLKIEPFQQYVATHTPCVVYVGIRADEADRDGVKYEEMGGVERRYPLMEWGWAKRDVLDYLEFKGVIIPRRTDCAACFFQTLWEWYVLYRDHPKKYAQAEKWEEETGHTFRSPQRDQQPASLSDLREKFDSGYRPPQRGMSDREAMCSFCAR